MIRIVFFVLLLTAFFNSIAQRDSLRAIELKDSLDNIYLEALSKTKDDYEKKIVIAKELNNNKLIYESNPKDVARVRGEVETFILSCQAIDSNTIKLQQLEILVEDGLSVYNNLEELQRGIKEQLLTFEEVRNKVDKTRSYWGSVSLLAQSDSAYIGIFDNSSKLENEYQLLLDIAHVKINSSREFEAEIDSFVVEVSRYKELLGKYFLESKKQYWYRNTPPIWGLEKVDQLLIEVKDQLILSHSKMFSSTFTAIQYGRINVVALLLIFFTFYVLLIYLNRSYKANLDSLKVDYFRVLVNHPLAGAIYLSLMYYSIQNPIVLKESLKLFVYIFSIPLLKFLNEILGKQRLKLSVVFWAYFLIYYIYDDMVLSALAGSLMLFMLFIYSISFLEVFYLSLVKHPPKKHFFTLLLEFKIIRVLQAVLIAALILLSVGYYYLANRIFFITSTVFVNLIVMVMFYYLSSSFIKPLVVEVISKVSIYVRNFQGGVVRTLKGINFIALLFFVIYTYLIRFNLLNDFSDEFSYFWNREYQIESLSISFGGVVSFIFIVWFTFYFGRLLNSILKYELFSRFKFRKGVPESVTIITRYVITIYGLVISLAVLGLDLDKMMIVLGALGVGIGFGLQNIINNLVSGLVIIMEKPLLVGDIVKIGNLEGEVKDIGIRSSTIYTYEGSEVIVPNGNLVSKELINLSLSDSIVRIEVNVEVAFGTDTKLVMNVLKSVALTHPKVLKTPAPLPLFAGFGENALKFDMLLWTDHLDSRRGIRSDVYLGIESELKKAGVEIPIPQRDLRIREGGNSNIIDPES